MWRFLLLLPPVNWSNLRLPVNSVARESRERARVVNHLYSICYSPDCQDKAAEGVAKQPTSLALSILCVRGIVNAVIVSVASYI
jgi:hypothetical protein